MTILLPIKQRTVVLSVQSDYYVLSFVGNWLNANSEAIYGAAGNPFNDKFLLLGHTCDRPLSVLSADHLCKVCSNIKISDITRIKAKAFMMLSRENDIFCTSLLGYLHPSFRLAFT